MQSSELFLCFHFCPSRSWLHWRPEQCWTYKSGLVTAMLGVLWCLLLHSLHTPCLSPNLFWPHSPHTPGSAPSLCIGPCCLHYLSIIPSNILWWGPSISQDPLKYNCLSWNSSPFTQTVLSICSMFVSVVVAVFRLNTTSKWMDNWRSYMLIGHLP